jgi:hypothetical protein
VPRPNAHSRTARDVPLRVRHQFLLRGTPALRCPFRFSRHDARHPGGALLTIGNVRWRVAKERVRAGHGSSLVNLDWVTMQAGSIVNAYAYKVKVSRFRRF